jgi:hypothetical protein
VRRKAVTSAFFETLTKPHAHGHRVHIGRFLALARYFVLIVRGVKRAEARFASGRCRRLGRGVFIFDSGVFSSSLSALAALPSWPGRLLCGLRFFFSSSALFFSFMLSSDSSAAACAALVNLLLRVPGASL